MKPNCEGQHRFFVADVAVVEDEAKVVIIMACTQCGETVAREHFVRNVKQTDIKKGK